MVTDRQVKRLWKALSSGKTLAQSADKADMDEKTARKYRRLGRLPSEVAPERTWRTREDPFAEVWPEVHEQLEEAPGLEAKTLFAWLQTKYPGKFDDSQLRSFQRGVKRWRATAGPAKEVFFSQVHHPGRLCASDFTHMNEPGRDDRRPAVRPPGLPLRADVLELGVGDDLFFGELREPQRRVSKRRVGVGRGARAAPHGSHEPGGEQRLEREGVHRAVHGTCWATTCGDGEDPGPRSRTRTATPSSRTGDSRRRSSRPCCCVAAGTSRAGKPTTRFLQALVAARNAGRRKRLDEELPRLGRLPERRRESYKRLSVRVDRGSLIHVDRNTYSGAFRFCRRKLVWKNTFESSIRAVLFHPGGKEFHHALRYGRRLEGGPEDNRNRAAAARGKSGVRPMAGGRRHADGRRGTGPARAGRKGADGSAPGVGHRVGSATGPGQPGVARAGADAGQSLAQEDEGLRLSAGDGAVSGRGGGGADGPLLVPQPGPGRARAKEATSA